MESNKVHDVTMTSGDVEEENDGVLKDAVLGFLGSFNSYATKKTAGQGLLDFALLAANISKLQDLFRRKRRDAVFYVLTTIICVSIALQLIVGVMMAVIGKMNLKTEENRKKANFLNNVITVLLSVITFVNIIISVTDVSAGD
ncbi:ninjurin-2 [Folsomia candida]|uniref:Ninjurin-1 n=1 Tax=Folsomia candida TaxID=158441 RepID=A0A226EGS5_FOLCA|nr:ninjurin-2 [Folsomia candida]OXA56347.1 Ninjurin-1 [Folsomia candida]